MKWQKFREFLVDFKEQDVNVEQMLNGIPKVEVQKCKEQAALRVRMNDLGLIINYCLQEVIQ